MQVLGGGARSYRTGFTSQIVFVVAKREWSSAGSDRFLTARRVVVCIGLYRI